jgi:arylsulfatase A-like enzyme
VPLIVVPPRPATASGAPPQAATTGRPDAALVCDEPVSTGLDLLPTLADLAGIAVEPAIGGQRRLGRSLAPLLADPGAQLDRDYVAAETYLPEARSRGRMIRSRDCKYVAYDWGKHREQLFDLARDPGEMVNLAVESRFAGVLREHREHLRAWLEVSGDTFARHYGHRGVAYTVPGDEWRGPTDIGPATEEKHQ